MNHLKNQSPKPKSKSRVTVTQRTKVQPYKFTDQRLMHSFEVALSSSNSIDTLLINLSEIVTDQTDCLSLWVCQRNENSEYRSPHLLTNTDGEGLWNVVEDHAQEMIQRVSKTRQICSSPIRSATETSLIVAPMINEIGADSPITMMLIGLFSSESQSVLRQQWMVGLVSQTIARWIQHRKIAHQQVQTRSLNDAFGLANALDATKTIPEAAVVVANHLRKLSQSEQVAVSFCQSKNGTGTLMAISDVESVGLESESNKIINHACNQAIQSGTVLRYPAAENEHSPALLALEKYCKTNGIEGCIALPLVSPEEKIIGSVVCGATAQQMNTESYQLYLEKMVSLVSGHVGVVQRANRGMRDVLRSRFGDFWKAKLTRTLMLVTACCMGAMFIPWPYRVACDCEVQPVMRRFIASPYDGILEKTYTESGELVTKDQIIAHLDGRQLRIELSVLRAEFDGAKKKRDSALAQGDIATSQIARSEMKRHQSKMDIIQQQLKNLEVKSPIDGIVVNGDLEKVEGAPLEMGQTLFEIAPLDEMVSEIGIPESEIQYVKPGMTVAIKLDAFPFRTWEGTIKNIYPRTEVLDDESVFIAQVKLPNELGELRPGMKGSAKITTELSPIGWNLFHRPWESVRYWTIW
jgi:RND family efflux transporter MFP subunit